MKKKIFLILILILLVSCTETIESEQIPYTESIEHKQITIHDQKFMVLEPKECVNGCMIHGDKLISEIEYNSLMQNE